MDLTANQIEIDYAYSEDTHFRCDSCGKFISIDQVSKSEFVPDSEYTRESTEFICIKCDQSSNKWGA